MPLPSHFLMQNGSRHPPTPPIQDMFTICYNFFNVLPIIILFS